AVSGRFGVAGFFKHPHAVIASWVSSAWFTFLGFAVAGIVGSLRSINRRDAAVALWVLAYAGLFTAAGAPDSTWYYAPVVPPAAVMSAVGIDALSRWFAALRSRNVPASISHPVISRAIVAVLLLAFLTGTARAVMVDPLGRQFAARDERRQMSAAILAAMK